MADEAVNRARALLGTPFRLHGRDPATGLDCVGLIRCCHPALADLAPGYGLRGGTAAGYAAMFVARGLLMRDGPAHAGDIMLMQASAVQFHLGLWCGDSLIHADAMLRCVVETPGSPRWPLIGAWHWPEAEDDMPHSPFVSSAVGTRLNTSRPSTSLGANGSNLSHHVTKKEDTPWPR